MRARLGFLPPCQAGPQKQEQPRPAAHEMMAAICRWEVALPADSIRLVGDLRAHGLLATPHIQVSKVPLQHAPQESLVSGYVQTRHALLS